MGVQFDNEVFEKFQALAIQDATQFEVGETYYSNSYPEKFTFLGLLTSNQHYSRRNIEYNGTDGDEIRWFDAEYSFEDCHEKRRDTFSIRDRNIGAHYNPWLIFKDEATMKACCEELKVEYTNDFIDYDDYDDFSTDCEEDCELDA